MEKIINKQGKPIVVYTALFGQYDILFDPRAAYDGCDFICFTDQENLQTEIWQQVKIDKERFESSIMANRHFKWLPHRYFPDYEFSLYLDSNIILYMDPNELVRKYLRHSNMAMSKHFLRDCLYKEAITCINENKLTMGQIYRQLKLYKESGYPENNGLFEQNIILRKHNDDHVIKTMEMVWDELKKAGNFRDQLVFSYIAWRLKQKVCYMEESARNGKGFIYLPHRKASVNVMKKIFIALRLRKRRYVDANLVRMMLKIASFRDRNWSALFKK